MNGPSAARWWWTPRELVASLLLGSGLVGLVSPVVLYVFVHGSTRRYEWVISGPAPFDRFGSGPFQFWLGMCLAGAGVLLIIVATVVKAIGSSRGDAGRPVERPGA